MDNKHPHNFRDLQLDGMHPERNGIKGLLVGFGIVGAIIALVLFLFGCTAVPPASPEEHAAAVSNAVDTATLLIDAAWNHWQTLHPASEGPSPEEDGQSGVHDSGAGPSSTEPATTPASSSTGPNLVFRYGGYKGAGAKEDPDTQIGALHMSKSGMSYKWTKGNLGNWGLAHTSAGALACAFYFDEKEGAWIGGKFDWISTSRTTRDWTNVRAGYNGWKPDPFFGAKKRAFCICSADGRKRTNLVQTEEP